MNGDEFIAKLNRAIDYWDDTRRSCGVKSQRDIALAVRFAILEVKNAAIDAYASKESVLSPLFSPTPTKIPTKGSKPRKSQGKGKGRASQ